MILKRTFSSDFVSRFKGVVILDKNIEVKLSTKHKVYKDDLIDALGDHYLVVMKTTHKDPPSKDIKQSSQVYEILCESENGKVLFIVGRLFPDGNLYIITSYWADRRLEKIYRQESEALVHE